MKAARPLSAWRRWRPYLNWREVRKFLHYVTGQDSFRDTGRVPELTADLRATAAAIRGPDYAPAIFIQGMMPRSGTVFIGQLLRQHPDLFAFPRHWFEVPFLQLTRDIEELQERFLLGYRHNRGKVDDHTFLALLGAAFIAHLQAATPPGKRMLFKVPNVEYLAYFPAMFPQEHLLVLLRDGRDLVDSTRRTWPMLPFAAICRRWSRAATAARRYEARHGGQTDGYWQARYEDAVADPSHFVRQACAHFGLDADRYPFDAIDAIRVRGSSNLPRDGRIDWHPREKPADFNPTGYWRAWPPRRKATFKRLAGHALIDLGYAPNNQW